MKKKVLLVASLFLLITVAFGQKKKVELSYSQEDVYVVLDEKLVGLSPKGMKLDFALGGEIYFFKRGYYSHRVKVDPETVFNKLSIDLIKKPKSAKAEVKRLLKPDTLLVSNIVTNFTAKDIQEILDENFIENNYMIGKSAALFPGAIDEIQNSRYKIAVEIVDSKQVRSVYKAPRFMMAFMKIRWSLLDKDTNKVVYFNSTDGTYFVKIQSPKGMVISEMMVRVMEGAIKEAQFKLLKDKKFINLIAND